MDAAATVVAVLIAAIAGYFFRRREHLRERRLEAYQQVFAAFLDAARTGADMLSVHTQLGFPEYFDRTTDKDGRRNEAYAEVFAKAATCRRDFEVAAYGVELVSAARARADIDALRDFLAGALYSGSPWVRGVDPPNVYPAAKLNPSDIESKAVEVVEPCVHRAARELWRRLAPRPPRSS